MLTPTEYAEQIRSTYNEERKKVNFLIIGNSGTGKTVLAETCPAPVHIDSFDPGGTVSVRKAIHEGIIIADTSFEKEDDSAPWAYESWGKAMHERLNMGYFDSIGTYVLDSLTMFVNATMNWTMKKGNHKTRIPELQHYNRNTMTILDELRAITRLPCHTIVTAHVDQVKDELSGRIYAGLMVTKRLKGYIPLLFDEVLFTEARPSPKGAEYTLMTGLNGIYQARSRLAREGGEQKTFVEPSIKELLKRGGYSVEDRELI